MSYDGTIAINPSIYRKLPFDPQKDLAPVASVAPPGTAAPGTSSHDGRKS